MEAENSGILEVYPLDPKIVGILSPLGGILKKSEDAVPEFPLDFLGSERLWCESSTGLRYSCSPETTPVSHPQSLDRMVSQPHHFAFACV